MTKQSSSVRAPKTEVTYGSGLVGGYTQPIYQGEWGAVNLNMSAFPYWLNGVPLWTNEALEGLGFTESEYELFSVTGKAIVFGITLSSKHDPQADRTTFSFDGGALGGYGQIKAWFDWDTWDWDWDTNAYASVNGGIGISVLGYGAGVGGDFTIDDAKLTGSFHVDLVFIGFGGTANLADFTTENWDKFVDKLEFGLDILYGPNLINTPDTAYFDPNSINNFDWSKWENNTEVYIEADTYDYYSGEYVQYGNPVILDLDGTGLSVTPLTSSNTFYDMAGDGYQHRTAWAGVGNGVLVLDLEGDGQITERNQVIFTDWDPSADSDMQALANVFDTNKNGKLDAGDEAFASFKLMVTGADGTTTLKTLAEAGVESIDLTANAVTTILPDGSEVQGEANFTRTDGSTGTAGTVAFAYDASGHAVTQTITQNADGSTTINNKALSADGSLANETTTVTSADGLSRTIVTRHRRGHWRRGAGGWKGSRRRFPLHAVNAGQRHGKDRCATRCSTGTMR